MTVTLVVRSKFPVKLRKGENLKVSTLRFPLRLRVFHLGSGPLIILDLTFTRSMIFYSTVTVTRTIYTRLPLTRGVIDPLRRRPAVIKPAG